MDTREQKVLRRMGTLLRRLTCIVVFLIVAGTTYAIADDNAAANKIFVETAQLLKKAAAANPTEAIGLYEQALQNLDRIVATYPSSTLAVQIVSGQSIGQVSRPDIEKARKALLKARYADDAKKDQERLQGAWETIEFMDDGKLAPEKERKEIKVIFRGEKMMLTVHEFSFELDLSKKPKGIDFTPSDDRPVHETGLGIYELKGDELKLCLPQKVTKDRPTEFKAAKGSGLILLVLKRSNKEKVSGTVSP